MTGLRFKVTALSSETCGSVYTKSFLRFRYKRSWTTLCGIQSKERLLAKGKKRRERRAGEHVIVRGPSGAFKDPFNGADPSIKVSNRMGGRELPAPKRT